MKVVEKGNWSGQFSHLTSAVCRISLLTKCELLTVKRHITGPGYFTFSLISLPINYKQARI